MEPDDNQQTRNWQETLTLFRNYSVEQWGRWLNAILSFEPIEPRLLMGAEELDAVLLGLYENLGSKVPRDRFAEALVGTYESTPFIEGHEEVLYNQLLLIAAIKPLRAKRLLIRHLVDEESFNIHLKDLASNDPNNLQHKVVETAEDLHTMVLSALGQYDVDDTVVNYIQQSSIRIKDFNYLLVCFRVLASGSEVYALDFLDTVISEIRSNAEAHDIALELKAEFARTGYRSFCEWYCNNASKLASSWPQQMTLFEAKVGEVALPAEAKVFASGNDKYAYLLELQLYAEKFSYSAEDLVRIARLYPSFSVDLVTNALHNIWRRIYGKSGTAPWNFISLNEMFVGGSRPSSLRAIEVVTSNGEVDWCQFNVREEPDLDFIFERVKTYEVLGTDLAEIEVKINQNRDKEKSYLAAEVREG